MNKLILSLCLFIGTATQASQNRPITVAELKDTSVKITNLQQTSGGTGSVFKSNETGSLILTNKHVCRLIEPGGLANLNGRLMEITEYQKFKDHDLCLVKVKENLGINLKVSDTIAPISSTSIVSGHPSLLPHIVTNGHLSEREDISLTVGIKSCTEKDLQEDVEACVWFGGKPVNVTLNAQLISNLIKPGNSGSAVFNSKGEIIGVVFAGSGRDFSYGLIVPQIFVLYFTQNYHRLPFTKVGTPVDDEGVSDRIFNFNRCRKVDEESPGISKKVIDFCKSYNDTMIWRK